MLINSTFMRQGIFYTVLEKLNYHKDNSLENKLLCYTNEVIQGILSPNQLESLQTAKSLRVDAVYFKKDIYTNKLSPQLYLIDNSSHKRSKDELATMHKNIYSSCEVPLYIVIDSKKIEIYDCRKSVLITEDGHLSSSHAVINTFTLQDIDDAITLYSADLFDNGEFWESDEAKNKFLYNNSAYEEIISKLKIIRSEFHTRLILFSDKKLIDEILINCVLIKYLEENGLEETGNNLAESFFKKHTNCKTLAEVLSQNKLNILFDALDKHFNGGIFRLSKNKRQIIESFDASIIAYLFDSKVDRHLQTLIWEKYSFKYIPVELISNFYEELLGDLKQKNGAVYTPSFLVNHMVSDQLASVNSNEALNYKIIDISCGSGIFLVSAFKKLVQIVRYKNGTESSTINKKLIKKILENNIYGIDKDETAVKLSIFSLSIALCNLLTPKQIWTEIENFSNLSKNIKNEDFFSFINKVEPNSFDLVIGNPPFGSKRIEYEEIVSTLKGNGFRVRFNSPKHEKSLIFFELSFYLAKKNTGKINLVLPSGPFLYFNDSHRFYEKVFSSVDILRIFDLTFLRRKLFSATISTIVVSAVNREPETETIEHIVVKRTTKTEQKLFFEIDYYDIFNINISEVRTKKYLWKTNLLGGGRVADIIERIKKFDYTINDFIRDKGLKKNRVSANDFLGIKYKLLIGKSVSSTPSKPFPRIVNPLITSEFISIYTDTNNAECFNIISEYITNNSDLIRFYIAATSGRQGLRGSYTFIDSDLLNFPYIQDISRLKLNDLEESIINEVVTYKIEEFGKGENAQINSQIKSGIQLERIIGTYGNLYSEIINSVFSSEGNYFSLKKIYNSTAFYAVEFSYKSQASLPILDRQQIKGLFSENTVIPYSDEFVSHRVYKIYLKKSIIIVKPKSLRYWLKSVAVKDAEDDITKLLLDT